LDPIGRRMTRILVYEPDVAKAEKIKARLETMHLWVVVSSSAEAARELISKQLFHLCVWRAESLGDLDTVYRLKQLRSEMAIVIVSSFDEPAFVVACMRSGASNFWSDGEGSGLDKFSEVISETLARVIPTLETQEIDFPFPQFVGRHPLIQEVFQLILSIRNSDSTVLITGESGSGKEIVARAIHDLSPRIKQPWVAVNCGAIPASLLESELFGHVKGAFTGATQNRPGRFQLAGAGSLFLDEISDLSFDLQSKILRAIQNRTFEPVGSPHSCTLDARIIAATNQNLETAVAEKRFRQDLFYRLNVIPVTMPPLRHRKSDIPLLVRYFLDRFNKQNQKSIPGISEEAMQCLMQYHWPGNIRELENLVERVVVLKNSPGIIERKDFPVGYFQQVRLDRFVANVALPEEGLDFNVAVREFESELILQALQRTSGNKNKAASLLNLNRTTLVEKLKRKGLRITS
jgi:DNA-binding NtrC family response regulator